MHGELATSSPRRSRSRRRSELTEHVERFSRPRDQLACAEAFLDLDMLRGELSRPGDNRQHAALAVAESLQELAVLRAARHAIGYDIAVHDLFEVERLRGELEDGSDDEVRVAACRVFDRVSALVLLRAEDDDVSYADRQRAIELLAYARAEVDDLVGEADAAAAFSDDD